MKKIVCFTVILAVIITGLFAGGGQQKAKGPKDHYVFGYIGYDFSTEWGDYAARAFNYAASRAPKKVEVITLDSKLDLEESVKCMESLIQQGVDGISLFPISPEQGFQLIKMANAAGIPITIENYLFNNQPESVTGKFIGAIGCEYDLIGYEAIKFIAQNKPGAKVYFCAGQKGGGVVELYEDGVNRAFKEFAGKVSLVTTLYSDWLTEKAYNDTSNLITSGTQFDYIFANNGDIAKGCYQALVDNNITDVPIVSTGGSPSDYQMLKEGVESANMTAPVSLQGVQTFKNLYEFVVEGKNPDPKHKPLPVVPISASKLSEFIAWDDYEAAYNFVYGGK
jgi:ABC-type sugar transport system substrate-binding protein